MAKPKKIVLPSDDQKRFGPEVFNLIRIKLTPMVGGNVNLGVKLAAEYFASRKPGEVTATEMGDAIPQIAAKFEAESKRPASDNSGRLPFDGELQSEWDAGLYKGQVTVRGVFKRFAAEIKDGVDITKSMFKAYLAELAVEKARIAALADEHDDPDSGLVACGSPVHRGDNALFQPTVRYRLTRNEAGELVRKHHSQGDALIEVGNFLVVPAGDEEGATDCAVLYCENCRDAAWEFGRQNEQKVTFYTASGAKRKLDAMKKSAEGNAALGDQIKAAAARTFGRSGTRSQRDWRTTRQPRGR